MTTKAPATAFGIACAVSVTALVLALAAVSEFWSWRRAQRELGELLNQGGLAGRDPEGARDVGRQPLASRAELLAARLILADELDRSWRRAMTREELLMSRHEAAERLAAAGEIASRALAVKPASWQAAMILGAARYLEVVRQGGPMGPEQRESWKVPLELARRLAPGKSEPTRFLAAAALSDWGRLSLEDREESTALLASAFEDQRSFNLLIEPWLRVAPSESLALSIVPDTAGSWKRIERIWERDDDWERLAKTRRRWAEALSGEHERRVADAEARLAGGDLRHARRLLLSVFDDLDPDKSTATRLESVMARLPPGRFGAHRANRLRAWLDWNRDRCLLEECLLSAAATARIAAGAQLDPLHESAVVALMMGDLAQADLYARRATSTLLPEWGPYLLLRARHLAKTGDLIDAATTLARVHDEWTGSAAFHVVATAIGRESPGARQRGNWRPEQWRPASPGVRLEIVTPAACGFEIEIAGPPGGGGVAEMRWDGETRGWLPFLTDASLLFELPVAVGAHILELNGIAGSRLSPRRASLRPCTG